MVNYSISLLAIASCIALSSTTTAVNAATHQLRAQQQKQYDPTLHSQTTTQQILSSPYYRYGGNDATNNGSDGRKEVHSQSSTNGANRGEKSCYS